MKTRYLKSIMIMLMVWMVMPVIAQDYFTVTFKDGREERHLLKFVKEITTSKYDADGVLHSDYVSQKVAMQNTVYYYPLTDIESVSFQKVTEEEIIQNTTSALSTIGGVLNNCESFSEICLHADDISNAPGVEKVKVYDNSIVIRIKDWRDIIIIDIPNMATPPLANLPANTFPLSSRRTGQDTQNINHSVRVAIVNQNSMNDDRAWQTDFWQALTDKFLALGYDADYIPAPSLEFFNRDIFSYDAVMLTTHGSYTENLHWFVTGEEMYDLTYIDVLEGGIRELINKKLFNSLYDMDDVTFTCIPEKRGGNKKSICYAACSEEYIRKSPLNFEHEDAIIFMNVCETFDGNNALADIFFDKGASILFGYTGTTGYGYDTGRQFYESMLNGNSVQQAFLKIPSDFKWENDYKSATLQLRQKKGTDLFLTKTVTAPSSEIKDELLDDGAHLITLYGYTTVLNDGSLGKGFYLSRNPDMSETQTVDVTNAFTPVNSNFGNKQFEISLKINPGETCYYQAFTHDGKNPNYGDICSFTVPTADQLCPAKIAHVVLDSAIYKRNDEKPNYVYFTVSSTLDDLTDVEEWGVYYESNSGKTEFAYNTVAHEQSKNLLYNQPKGWACVNTESFVLEVNGEVGPYVKKRDKTTGNLVTYYGSKFSYTLRYDQKPSFTMFDPVILKTEIIDKKNGNNRYKTTTSYKRTIEGAFWIDYIDRGISGEDWTLTENNPWYPVHDGTFESTWSSSYWDSTASLGHTTWFILHLRNSQTITSNYLNWSGDNLITNVWVSSSPSYSRKKAPANDSGLSTEENSGKMNYVEDNMPIDSNKQSATANKEKIVVPYKDGLLGAY